MLFETSRIVRSNIHFKLVSRWKLQHSFDDEKAEKQQWLSRYFHVMKAVVPGGVASCILASRAYHRAREVSLIIKPSNEVIPKKFVLTS